jgi:hypothetical protein
VLADGSFTLLAYPAGGTEVCNELQRVLRAGGRCVMRCFVQTELRETTEQVLADLAPGISSFLPGLRGGQSAATG